MRPIRVVPAVLVLAVAVAVTGCGSSAEQPAPASSPDSAVAAAAPAAGEAAATTEAPAAGDAALPQDPCSLLTAEQVATVLTGPDQGTGASGGVGAGAGASCEWADAAGTTFLELTTFSLAGQGTAGLTAQALLQMRESTGLAPLDFGPVAIGGAEDSDAVVQWVGPVGLYQLRMYSVGAAEDPGTAWSTLQEPLQDLALVVNSG